MGVPLEQVMAFHTDLCGVLVHLVLEPGGGEEDEADGLLARDGDEDCGVDLVPHFKLADDSAEAELTLSGFSKLGFAQTAACWKEFLTYVSQQFSEQNPAASLAQIRAKTCRRSHARL